MHVFFYIAAFIMMAGCQPEPQPICYGEDLGAHCRMTIADDRYGTELLTKTGKAYKFDSVECLAGYMLAHPDIAAETHSLWVTAFGAPGTLIPISEAFFLHAPALRSPMGMNLTAFAAGTAEDAVLETYGGEILSWDEVLALLEAASPHGRTHSHGIAH